MIIIAWLIVVLTTPVSVAAGAPSPVVDVGSQYLMGFVDSGDTSFDGGKTYEVTLPPYIHDARSEGGADVMCSI